jgi:uncharacterized protein (TIGR02231 family)
MRPTDFLPVRFTLALLIPAWFLGLGAATHAATDLDRVHEVRSSVDKVVLYRGVASVERVVELELESGIHELVFTGLPMEGVDWDGIRASVTAPWQVLAVDYSIDQVVVPEGGRKTLKAAVQAARERLRRAELEKKGVEEDLLLLGMVGVRAVSDASGDAGTPSLDLEAIRAQFEFIRSQRSAIQKELLIAEQEVSDATDELQLAEQVFDQAGWTEQEIVARVRIASTTDGVAKVSLRYLKLSSGWEPTYSIRSGSTSKTMSVEYEALVRQETGEDWNDIELSLSTAMPSEPSGPGEITPVFVDRKRVPPPASRKSAAPVSAPLGMSEDARVGGSRGRPAQKVAEAMRNAMVADGGTAVTFRLPGRVTIPTDSMSATRLRIAGFEAPANQVLVTRPVADPGVYLRADLVNESSYVLLAGQAALFAGGEYLGSTEVSEVPAGGDFEVWFGIDPSITVTREVLGRETERTGLLGGGRETTTDYRIDLANLSAQAASVEVWDRRPVSRDEDIDVRMIDVSPGLATDQTYLDTAALRGLLKWTVDLAPAGAEGASRSISWSTQVSRPKDLEITPIPK